MNEILEQQPVSLLDISAHGANITLNGKSYALRQLTLDDYARIEAYIRTQRLNHVRDMILTTRDPITNLPALDPEVQAEAISRTICAPMTFGTIWTEFDGELMMIARALVGNPGIPEGKGLEFVKRHIPPLERETVIQMVRHVCGLLRPLGIEKGESKSTTAPAISPPSDPNSGTVPLEVSAATTE